MWRREDGITPRGATTKDIQNKTTCLHHISPVIPSSLIMPYCQHHIHALIHHHTLHTQRASQTLSLRRDKEKMDFSSSGKAVTSLVKRLQQQQQHTNNNEADLPLPAAQLLASALMAKPSTFTLTEIEAPVLTLVASPARWECLCVGLLVCLEALERMAPSPALSCTLREALYNVIQQHMEHEEPRVRTLVAKMLGTLCSAPALGTDAYLRFQSQLWGVVDAQLMERTTETRTTNLGGVKEIPLDDVTGWHSLETSMLALTAVVEGCGPELVRQGLLTPADWLEKAVFVAAGHQNRYIREAAMTMVRVLVERCASSSGADLPSEKLAAVVAEGLADAWPQVVYAAARATRALLLTPGQGQAKNSSLFPLLLSPLCQSRYYVPEGVQVHAQETWMSLFPSGNGRKTVASCAQEMVHYHCHTITHGRSHFARIAACYALKEMAAKVETGAMRPFASQLVDAILPCLMDYHWEVRSAGCVALAEMAGAFPEAVQAREGECVGVCFARLEDESWSIREEAAVALVAMARHAVGGEKEALTARLVERLAMSLEVAQTQPAQTREEQLKRFNDPQAHTGRPVYGCCGGQVQQGHGHAHSHTHNKYHYAAQQWEVSEGALYLFRELCAEDVRPKSESGDFVEMFLPKVAELGRLQHFADADRLRQSLWKVLPEVMLRLGKPTLKRHLELFTPALLLALGSPLSSPLTRSAAMGCMEALSRQMGPSIFLGRLSEGEKGLFLGSASFGRGVWVGGKVGESGGMRPSVVSM